MKVPNTHGTAVIRKWVCWKGWVSRMGTEGLRVLCSFQEPTAIVHLFSYNLGNFSKLKPKAEISVYIELFSFFSFLFF
jgi:hypothetical protein